MRSFRVVAVLQPQDFQKCFSVTGKLKRPHKGEIHRSLRAATTTAQQWVDAGWYAYIVRRTPTGWTRT